MVCDYSHFLLAVGVFNFRHFRTPPFLPVSQFPFEIAKRSPKSSFLIVVGATDLLGFALEEIAYEAPRVIDDQSALIGAQILITARPKLAAEALCYRILRGAGRRELHG